MEKQISTISGLVSTWRKKALSALPKYHTLLQQAIDDFEAFGLEYQDYFEDVIDKKSFLPEKTTVDRLRHQYMQTLQGYWLSLEQVVLQWQTEYYSVILEQAYEQSSAYLNTLRLPLPGSLIYFNRVTSIRYLPFTKIPILGIPHLFSGPKRWSAMAHEIGHYLFWNLGNSLDETPGNQEQLRIDAAQYLSEAGIAEKERGFVMPWLEEVFCDVAGTYIDGSGFVDSSEEFLRCQAGNETETTFNDGHHPPLLLRPFVWRRALKNVDRTILRSGREPQLNPGTNIEFPALVISGEERTRSLVAVPHEHEVETASAETLLPALETLVDFLNGKFDEILTNVHPRERTITAFQELKSFMEAQKATGKRSKSPVYEMLLTPRVFEGGIEHTHGYYIPFHGWHESSTHSH